MTVKGTCLPEFEGVREEFERNFADRGEAGASVCVVVDGEPVIDLWGGVAHRETGRPYESDTIHMIASASKGATVLCGHLLIDRGQLDLDAPVTHYWPEFGKNGKDGITVRQVFNHQSGLVVFSDVVPQSGFNDWDIMVSLIENATLRFEPGTRVAYHGITIGWMIGELVHRVSGQRLGAFFREQVADPLDLDMWIGLPEKHLGRVAPCEAFAFTPDELPPHFAERMMDPSSFLFGMVTNSGGWLENWNARESLMAEIPATGVVTNARAMAGMYAPLSLGGSIGSFDLVGEDTIARMRYPQSMVDVDGMLGTRTSFTLGFSKSWPNPHLPDGNSVIIGEDAFGCPGGGGSIGFADPSYRLAFGYTMTMHGIGTGLNRRGQSLIDATYRALGSPTNAPGCWVRRP